MDNYEEICFGIISYAGTAKSCFLEAIELAKNKQNYNDKILICRRELQMFSKVA